MSTPDPTPFAHIAQRIDPNSRLLDFWPLAGGISAQVTAIRVLRESGRAETFVVRRYGAGDLSRNPRVARDEYSTLEILAAEGLPVPAPVYADPDGLIFGTPCIVVEFVKGSNELSAGEIGTGLRQLAAVLARIHRVDMARHDLSFLSTLQETVSAELEPKSGLLDETLQEGRIRAALSEVWPLKPRNRHCLLHGDYWPGNVLWQDGTIAAVVDWEDTMTGDPLADLSTARLEIYWKYGLDAMTAFTREYLSEHAVDVSFLPYWDLRAALRPAGVLNIWAPDAETEAWMRSRHAEFVRQAFDALG